MLRKSQQFYVVLGDQGRKMVVDVVVIAVVIFMFIIIFVVVVVILNYAKVINDLCCYNFWN